MHAYIAAIRTCIIKYAQICIHVMDATCVVKECNMYKYIHTYIQVYIHAQNDTCHSCAVLDRKRAHTTIVLLKHG